MSQGVDIWVQVTCGKCGCMACNSGWYHDGIVGKLRKECKDWKKDYTYGTICPDCYKDLKAEGNYRPYR